MGQLIAVEHLNGGDLFYEPRALDRGLRRVNSTRGLHLAGVNYRVVSCFVSRSDGVDLFDVDYQVGFKVIRVAPIDYPLVAQQVSLLRNNEHAVIWRGPDGRLYA